MNRVADGGGLVKALCLALFSSLVAGAEEADLGSLLDRAIQQEIQKLPPNSQHLPGLADGVIPPPWIDSAGKEFVDAWKVWRLVSYPGGNANRPEPPPIKREDLINAYSNPKPFEDLLRRLVDSNASLDPAQFDRFTYEINSWCGNAGDGFRSYLSKGLALCNLRKGRLYEAMQNLGERDTNARDGFFDAFGVDRETFVIGEWLNGFESQQSYLIGREKTARMAITWAEMNWAPTQVRNFVKVADQLCRQPQLPRTELLWLLRPDNGVTAETRLRIAKFIQKRGEEIVLADSWVAACPKGVEPWLVSFARKSLQSPLNRTRLKASGLLTSVGIDHPAPVIRPDPRFRVRLNGEPWPGALADLQGNGPELHMVMNYDTSAIKYTGDSILSGAPFSAKLLKPDVLTFDADAFQSNPPVKSFYVSSFSSDFGGGFASPNIPRLRADISPAVKFEEENIVDIRTVTGTIRPILPQRKISGNDGNYEVELKQIEGGGRATFAMQGDMPLILPHVSPGMYLISVHHPGAVQIIDEKVTISSERSVYDPQLKVASSLVIPLDTSELKMPTNPPHELERLSSDPDDPDYLHWSLGLFMRFRHADGSEVKEQRWIPRAAQGRFPNSALYPSLPPGEYLVDVPEQVIESNGTKAGGVISGTATKVVIREDSPVFVVSEPLKIRYEEKN